MLLSRHAGGKLAHWTANPVEFWMDEPISASTCWQMTGTVAREEGNGEWEWVSTIRMQGSRRCWVGEGGGGGGRGVLLKQETQPISTLRHAASS